MAMTAVVTRDVNEPGRGRVIKVTCTFDTTPGTAAATLTAAQMAVIGTGFVRDFITVPGATGPTDNSDLAIADSRGLGIIASGSNGANVVDNATVNIFAAEYANLLVHSAYAWTITVTNNAVNNSSFDLYIDIEDFLLPS